MELIDSFIEKAKHAGLKLTPQRMMIFKILAESQDHPSAEMLYRKVQKLHPTISMNTVYQTLNVLKMMGLVTRIDLDDKSARFEANVETHHHAVCRSCGKIEDVYDEHLKKIAVPKEIKKKFRITDHSIAFYGVCNDCREKENS